MQSPATLPQSKHEIPTTRADNLAENLSQITLSLPSIHCQGCIANVERTLNCHSGVQNARVNLTLKRVFIDTTPDVFANDLIQVLESAGFEAHELDSRALQENYIENDGQKLLLRLAVAGFATMNVMLLSISVWSGADTATRDFFHWLSAAIALPAIAFAAQPFFKNAWNAIKARRLNMDVPIVLAILLALVSSLCETILSGHHAYFDAAIALTFFLLIGRYLDYRTRASARSAAKELTALESPYAIKLINNVEVTVSVDQLQCGDLICMKPGERIPVDGIVFSGQSEIDRSFVTGETLPAFIKENQVVNAGEVNLTAPLVIRASAVGKDTTLQRITELVAVAESGRSSYTSLADHAAKLYAPGVHILSALSFLGWLFYTWDMRTSLNIAAAVLIITCPCALGLAVPTVTTAASGKLFQKGMLIKNATALERLANVNTVVFDKTGTLTTGAFNLLDSENYRTLHLEVALPLASASAHPLSRALVHAASVNDIKPQKLKNIVEIPGYGVEGYWGKKRVRLGRANWVSNSKKTKGPACWLGIEGQEPQVFYFSDTLRPKARETIAALQADNKEVIMYSGDSRFSVHMIADQLGITKWHAEALPEDKAQWIQSLKDEGKQVLMVGDGLNDTAALSVAHVSISPSSALDITRVASDIVLLGNSLMPISDAISLAQKAVLRIRQNFQIATMYNVIAIPLAVAGMATPLVAALAMSVSSVSVSLNALRLK